MAASSDGSAPPLRSSARTIGAVERLREQHVQFTGRGARLAARRRRFVLGFNQREFGLHQLQPRHVAGVEARLRRFPRARGQADDVVGQRDAAIAADQREIRAAHAIAQVDGDPPHP